MEPHHRLKAQWTLQPDKCWRLQTAGQLHRTLSHTGTSIQQSLRYTSPADLLRLALMAAYFHATDYSARLYAYEPALLSSVSSAILYGHGLHAAFTARLTSRGGRWMGEVKYSLYRFFDRDQQSSGLQTIMGPWKNDLSFQVRFKF